MKRLVVIAVAAVLMMLSCSKENSTNAFRGNWEGIFFTDSIAAGRWQISIADNGSITGKIVSAPGVSLFDFAVTGTASNRGQIDFTSYVSSTLQLNFTGTLSGIAASGNWTSTGPLVGNPASTTWNGTKQ